MKEYVNMFADNAQALEEYVEIHFRDSNNVLRSCLDSATGAPLTQETFAGCRETLEWKDWYREGYTQAEYGNYENCGMTSGAYLSALIIKYKLTQDPKTLERIQKSVAGIFHIAEIGKQLEYGFLPKIYGERFSEETSTDQVLYELNALDEYRRLDVVSAEERAKIDELIVAAVEFWRKRNYHYTYFIFKDMKWPDLRFPSLLALAYNVTGDETYRKEAEELLEKNITNVPENARFRTREMSDKEKADGIRYIWGIADATAMDTLNAMLFMRSIPDSVYNNLWLGSMLVSWIEGKRSFAPDGQLYTTTQQDLKTGEITQCNDIGSEGTNGARTAWSTMVTRASLLAAKYNPELRPEVLSFCKDVLKKFDYIEQLNYIDPQDADRLPDYFRFKTRFISGDAVANALWSYYLIKELEA